MRAFREEKRREREEKREEREEREEKRREEKRREEKRREEKRREEKFFIFLFCLEEKKSKSTPSKVWEMREHALKENQVRKNPSRSQQLRFLQTTSEECSSGTGTSLGLSWLRYKLGDDGIEDQRDIKGYDGIPGNKTRQKYFNQIEFQTGLSRKRP
ncbi:hypothetical protein DUI87_11361 [Hirundo rustica rustica]|uniref:Uncharacterized protein n=1 Tax=Hirundo rustica rustica TaxID=333673 RepID=A0A3M0KIY9_HIRRU|nr:hypothetical protein DUI87_11361 [Hirundo rustica rustica]